MAETIGISKSNIGVKINRVGIFHETSCSRGSRYNGFPEREVIVGI